jgi:DNA-binding transcriptional regulator YdaS (Cro superfamily)
MVSFGDHFMTLEDWMAGRDLTVPDFARTLGRSPEAVRRYIKGDRIPDRETMLAIARETSGEVTANDFFGIEQSPSEQARAA